MTIGILSAASLAARIAASPLVMMTSTGGPTSSAARPGIWSRFSGGTGRPAPGSPAENLSRLLRSGRRRPPDRRTRAAREVRGASFDDLVGTAEDRLWDCQPERGGRFEVDHQFKPSQRLDRRVGGLGTLKDLVDERSGTLEMSLATPETPSSTNSRCS